MSDEKTLIRQLKANSQLAFTSLYKTYSRDVYTLAFKYLCNRQLAEDTVQNVFFKIWEKRHGIDEDRPFNRYLFTILKNDLLNTLRNQDKEIFRVADYIESLQAPESSLKDKIAEEQQIELIKKAIEQLSPQKKLVFTMKMSGQYSNQEIADKLNLSVNTIKFQYSQALKEIKNIVRATAYLLLILYGL